MTVRARGSAPGSAPAGRDSEVEQWAAKRQLYVDNLKIILIAVVIAGHAVLGYSEFDWWSYADVREVTLLPAVAYVLLALAAPFGLLVIPLLFLVSGLLTPPSLDRKGPGRFIRDRLRRLGVPFAVFALLIWPLLEYALFRQLGEAPGLRAYFRAEGSLDTGVLWFVGALLIFSLAYAGWVWVRPDHRVLPRQGEIQVGHLLLLAAVVTVATFLVRLVLPFEPDNRYVDPEHMGMARMRGAVPDWASWHLAWGGCRPFQDRLRRRNRTVTLVAVCAAAAFAAFASRPGLRRRRPAVGWLALGRALVFAAAVAHAVGVPDGVVTRRRAAAISIGRFGGAGRRSGGAPMGRSCCRVWC